MADKYSEFVSSGLGKKVAGTLGLPQPATLRRYTPGAPLCDSPVLVGGGGHFECAVKDLLAQREVEVVEDVEQAERRLGGIVVDLSALTSPAELEQFRALAGPAVKKLGKGARVVIIGRDPKTLDNSSLEDVAHVAVQRSLEGITRSIAKELRGGATANLVLAASDSSGEAVRSAVEFFLSGRSAFVDAQVVRVGEGVGQNPTVDKPLEGKVAVVTGAARGIGASIARTMARDGASVVCVDVPAAGEALSKVANEIKGTALQLDVTAPEAGARIVEHCAKRHGKVDIVVHNAGITRDKLFVNTDESRWGAVLSVNLLSILQMNEALLGEGGLGENGRIVCVSSMSGIAGNRGQANYAASKAGVIGLVDALSEQMKDRGITVNAVAPGFIETDMTAKIPFATREAGRRMNSLSQGGLPVDVADTIAWFSQPGAQGITGQTIRVCGQSLLGA